MNSCNEQTTEPWRGLRHRSEVEFQDADDPHPCGVPTASPAALRSSRPLPRPLSLAPPLVPLVSRVAVRVRCGRARRLRSRSPSGLLSPGGCQRGSRGRCEGQGPPIDGEMSRSSTPAKVGRNVAQDRIEDVGAVVDTKLIGDSQ